MAVSLAVAAPARADRADERATEFLAALQHDDFAAASRISSAIVQSGMPRIEAAWKQETAAYGRLKSFEITDRQHEGRYELRVATLNFEHPSGLATQIAIDDRGNVTGIYFMAAKLSPEAGKIADDRINEMLQAVQSGKFDLAEAHFDSQMKSLFGPSAFQDAWKQRTASLGDLKAWRVAARAEVAGNFVRIVNLDFANAAKAFALKIAVNGAGEIGGLFFVQPQSEADSTSSTPPYVHPGAFTTREVKIGPASSPLGATITIPKIGKPFPGVVLVHGSGPNDRDETLYANHPFSDLAEGLSSNGIVVLRYDKRTRVYHAPVWTIDAEVIDDAVAAVDALRHQPEVDPARVFVLGHSLGALLAPEVATRAKADGVVMLAPPGIPLPDTVARQKRYLGASQQTVAQLEEDARLLKSRQLPPNQPVPGLGAPASYYYDLASHDEVAYARKLGKPILILRGTRDYQVVSQDIEVWRKALAHTRNVTIETFPNLNHLFITGAGIPGPDEYMVPGYVAPAVIAKVSAFILKK